MDWIICPSCEEEFKLVSDCTLSPLFCPYCGEDLPEDLYDEENDE